MRWPVLVLGVVVAGGLIVFAVSNSFTDVVKLGGSHDLNDMSMVLHHDEQYGFAVLYPASSTLSTQNFEGYLPVTANPLVGFALPESLFAGTNLIDAGLYIGASSDAQLVSSCMSPKDGEDQLGVKIIGGTAFNGFAATGAAAGNLYEQSVYRTVRSGRCYEIVELLHSGNIGNYPDGTVREFDKNKFQQILDKMLASFAFTSQAESGVEGKINIRCVGSNDPAACARQTRTVEAYQGNAAVGFFKTSEEGAFRAALPPGQYELRVGNSTSIRCVSIGVVVPEHSFVSANLSCEAGQ